MTLIVSYHHPATRLLAISDTVVSSPTNEGDSLPQVWLPFNERAVEHASGGYGLSGFRQKTVIFGRTMVMWAGSAIVATALIKTIRSMSADGVNKINVDEAQIRAGCQNRERLSVALIYHFNPSPLVINRTPWNCDVLRKEGDTSTIADGSGAAYFLDNLFVDNRSDAAAHETAFQAMLAKLPIHALSETSDRETLDFLYGGWFELTVQGPTSFDKIPYAIKMWSRGDGYLGSGGPAVACWYSGHNLVLTRMRKREPEPGKFTFHVDHSIVPDFLRREDKINIPTTVIRPYFIAHIVADLDEGIAYTYLQMDPESKDMVIEIGPGGIDCSWSEELRERLYAMRDKTIATEMRRRWQP